MMWRATFVMALRYGGRSAGQLCPGFRRVPGCPGVPGGDAGGPPVHVAGRGFHSATFHLNLSRFRFLKPQQASTSQLNLSWVAEATTSVHFSAQPETFELLNYSIQPKKTCSRKAAKLEPAKVFTLR
jgi:hypothetical protein